MKRILILLLCVLLLTSGCSARETANFYYQRAYFQYDTADGVIVAEERDISGHDNHMSFLLSLYLLGPQNAELISPLPAGTKLLSLERTGDTLVITLTDVGDSLTESEFSLACACLTMTCAELTRIQSVTTVSGEHSLTLTRDMLTLYDSGAPIETTTGG